MTFSLDFVSELRKHFSGDVRVDSATRSLYSTDASIYQIEPLGVALPRTQDDLIAAVELAAKYHVPILARGAGSSLAGQAIGQALILDCSRHLNKILEFDPQAQTVQVEPGVILAGMNRAVAGHGLMFGPDPASAERATMGGVIGNNATGAHSILYGMTADHLLSAEVILSDGSLAVWEPVLEQANQQKSNNSRQQAIVNAAFEIRDHVADDIRINWPASWRNSAGYRLNYLLPWSATRPPMWEGAHYPSLDFAPAAFNLATLLAGSEGTLAVIRSAKLNLVKKPRHTILGVLSFGSIVAACEAVPALLERSPSAVELIPQMLIRLARSIPAYASQVNFVQGDPAALLVVEFSGSDIVALRQKARALSVDVVIAETAPEQARVWNVRKVGLGIFDSRPADARPVAFIEDCAIPVQRLGEFVREVQRILDETGTQAAFYAHASAGCLHIRPILNLKTESGVHDLRSIAAQVLELTLRLGGAMSSEHGDGLVRAEWLRKTYGDSMVQAFEHLKKSADPHDLFNPKKLTGAPPMDTNLRYGQSYHAAAWSPALDFHGLGNKGLESAIEQCNGQGVCRKLDGVMCPSFQATREEEYSTRGRANLLRAMISLGEKRMPPKQVKQALDLCLACKGCKAECPSGVDMAKLKYEFQSHYFETHRRPLRDYLFGYIGQLARFGAPFGGLANSVMALPALSEILGLSNKRIFPKFRKSLTQVDAIPATASAESCLLLPDTFTHFFEPEVEQSALAVMKACSISVRTLPVFGAGRTLISKGFITAARQHAVHLLDAIRNEDPIRMLPIVGLEPSEIYTLRDELIDLVPERRVEAESLVARSWLIDEYLIRSRPGTDVRRIESVGKRYGAAAFYNGKVMLHGHCYQKAQPPHPDGCSVGVAASAELLRAVGYGVEVLDTGCCGMAGAFGYEDEHYAVSMQVGELKLLPEARRAASEQAYVAAPGTSCRSQIADGAGVQAQHTIQLVAQILSGTYSSDILK